MIHSYSSPRTLGAKFTENLFEGPVVVQEKIDGSQFSFGVVDGKLYKRSRNVNLLSLLDIPKIFKQACLTVGNLYLQDKLTEGWTYRGEVVNKQRHNRLTYERVPKGCLILFDVEIAPNTFLPPAKLQAEANRLELECVPLLGIINNIPSQEQLDTWLAIPSILGGAIEGIVFKNYAQLDHDKVLMGKYVSSQFKETSVGKNSLSADNAHLIAFLIKKYKTEARWFKAVQHLEEAGVLEHSPKDIGPLMRELSEDFERECAEEIEQWETIRKRLLKGISAGFAEWYKEQLLKRMLDEKL